jgi:chorismate dehydratase
MTPLRLSVVRYLNTRPLVYGLERRLLPHRFELTYDVPSVCADKVNAGEADLGIIPSIEYARSRAPYAVVPDIAIASYGAVRSIFLFHTVPVERIRSVALDTGSRTSVALTHIILNERYGVTFTPVEHPPVLDEMLNAADAALIIGDPALDAALRPEPHLDLGYEWTALTGLPFVYAFWAGRPDRLTREDINALIRSKEFGLTSIPEIATEYAHTHTQSTAFYEAYLSDHLYYALGPEEQEGLQAFYRRAHRLGLIPAAPALRFYER